MVEMYTGDLFFETHETYEHLALMERLCGKLPDWMLESADAKHREYVKKSIDPTQVSFLCETDQ